MFICIPCQLYATYVHYTLYICSKFYEYSSIYLSLIYLSYYSYTTTIPLLHHYTTGRLQNYKDTLLEKRSTMTKANSTYKQNILKLSQKLNKIRANLIEKRTEYAKLSADPDQDVNNINFNDQKKYSIDSLKLQITKQYLLLDKTTDWNEKKLIKNKINFLKREFNNYRFN